MIKDKKNIDLLFEEGLKGFRAKTPVHSWSRLENDLGKLNRKKTFVYLQWVAASILLLIAFGSGYYYATYKINNQIEIVESNDIPAQNKQIVNTLNPSQKNELSDEKTIPEDNTDINISNSSLSDDKAGKSIVNNSNNKQNQMNADKSDIVESIEIPINESIIAENENKEIADIEIPDIHKDEDPQVQIELIEENLTDANNIANLGLYPLPKEDYNIGQKNKNKNKWSVGAQFAPVISYRDINIIYTDNQQNSFVSNSESEYNNTENSLLSYSGGVDVGYDIGKRWSIKSGVYLSRIGQVNDNALTFKQYDEEYILYAINTSTGEINVVFEKVPEDIRRRNPAKDTLQSTTDINSLRVVQNFDLFEIPLVLRYKILDKKFGISVSGGLSPAYVLNNSTYLETDSRKYDVGSSSNLNTMILNSTFTLGINYTLSSNLSLNMEPTFKYSLNSLNNNSQFNYHPYYFSWFAGVRYSF